MKLDVLAIGAHPDDVELSCGGTIRKLVKQGRIVGICDLTEGELGTRGTVTIRRSESIEASNILGTRVRENLGLPDGNIEINYENRIKLMRVIRRYRPEILLFPHTFERHPDHEHAHRLCKEAWFYAGLAKVETEIDGIKQQAFRPSKYFMFMQTAEFIPSFIVDISEEYEDRVRAIRAFKSQFHDPESSEPETFLSNPEFMEFLRTRCEYLGDRIGRKYGEGFASFEPVKVDDLFSLI
ncbi:MAG: bacillithiol biosynthesis deacetylase BshB1 [Bacteroidota bacterium]